MRLNAGNRAVRALLVALAVLPAACGQPPKEEVETTAAVPVATVAARRGPIRATVRVTGVVKPAPGADLLVTAPQSARIAEIPRVEGERVQKGDLLVRFEIPALAADEASRTSDVARATARLANVRAAKERVAGLFERGIAARKEVEESAKDLAEAEAGLAEATGVRRASGVLAGRQVVRAPFAGVVAARLHNPGDLVEAGSGDPILRLLDPARLQVEAAVPLDQLAHVAVGNPARVSGPGAAAPAAATVRTRPAMVDPATGEAAVRLAFDQPTRLPAGTPVEVEILGPEIQAILVPAAAVVQEGTESRVFTVENGKAVRRRVTVGLTAGGLTEILSGVTAGTLVIIEGQQALPDGAQVSVGR